uniref:PDZ domain-containing protein n=1 Tax=Ascaris lumbricoides TaxID=6252 RepID=A0A0M3HTB0_ASCLU
MLVCAIDRLRYSWAAHASGVAFSAIPTAAPSFFANPFMTPFMPQQASSMPHANNLDTGDYRMNPLPSDSYFLQSVQYQEMMQQYIQNLMAAASALPSAGSEIGNQCFGSSTEAASAKEPTAVWNEAEAARMPVAALSERMQQHLRVDSAPSTAQLAQSASGLSVEETYPHREPPAQTGKTEESHSCVASVFTEQTPSSEHDYPPTNAHSAADVSVHTDQIHDVERESDHSANVQQTDCIDVEKCRSAKDAESKNSAEEVSCSGEKNISNEETSASGDTLEACSSAEVPTLETKSDDGSAKQLGHESATDAADSVTAPSASASCINKSSSCRQSQETSSQNSANDCRTSVLIKKQMNEIDKEINRRIQNKNIKKIDEKELAQLLSNANDCSLGGVSSSALTASLDEAALPFGAADVKVASTTEQRVPPSLNQLKNSYGLSQLPSTTPLAQQSLYQNHFPQQGSVCAMVKAAQQQSPSQHAPMPNLPFSATLPQVAQSAAAFAQPPATHFPAYFPPAQPMFFPGAQQPVTPQLAAAILQQFQHGQQMGLFPMAAFPLGDPLQTPHTAQSPQSMAASRPGQTPNTSIAPQIGTVNTTATAGNAQNHAIPPPPHSSHCFAATSHCTQPNTPRSNPGEHHWPDENGWNEIGKRHNAPNTTEESAKCENSNDAEPVWVMRDSYLKRMQREEDRNSENAEAQKNAEKGDSSRDDVVDETDRLLAKSEHTDSEHRIKKASKKEVIVHEPAVLIEGVLFRARYLGSTQLICEGRPTKTSRMMQAQEAVARVKAPAGEIQPSTDIDLFISTEKIMVLNTDLQDILMDHALRTISYIADIGDLVVLMARRMSQSASEEECSSESLEGTRRAPRVICHVFESEEASFIAQSIGQAFQVAYVEFLRANGIDDPSYLREIDYQEVLNSQEMMGEELEMFARKETQKDVVVPKKAGEPLGVVVVESGWGSMLPTVVIANLQPNGAASRCNQLNIGDQIIAINGISLVGLPLASAQQNIKAARSSTAVKLTVVSTPPVVEVRIKRPDTKYQLGFSVQNGVICSLLRGGIAERGGIRVGHRIIEINSQSVVAVAHEKIVNMLATAIGEIHMKTMPTSMFRLLTGQEVPNYI